MNIWLISKYAVHPAHGNPTRQYFFSEAFAKAGHEVTLVSSASNFLHPYIKVDQKYLKTTKDSVTHYLLPGKQIISGFSLQRISSWFFFELRAIKLLTKHYESKPADVTIVSSLSLLTFLTGVYAKFRFGVPLIVEVRDIWPLTIQHLKGYSKYNPIIIILRLVELLGYKYADSIIGSMPNLKGHIASKYHSKVYHIPHGVQTETSNQVVKGKNAKEIINQISPKNLNFIYTGSLGPANAIDEIISVVKEIFKLQANVSLHLVGNGSLKDRYIKKYTDLSFLKFHDPIEKADISALIREFDFPFAVILDDPLYKFGISPNKLNDYLFSGRPPIIVYSGFTCSVELANAGLVIPHASSKELASTILTWIKNTTTNEFSEKGKNGKAFVVNELDYSVLAKRYLLTIPNL